MSAVWLSENAPEVLPGAGMRRARRNAPSHATHWPNAAGEPMIRVLIVGALIAAPSAVRAQYVGGVQLGQTTIGQVRQIRRSPIEEGRTVDGKTYYLRYGDYTFYFGPDSIVEFARYFPTRMLRSELEQLVGSPKTEKRQANFQIEAIYSDTISALFDRLGRDVVLVEYSRRDKGGLPAGAEELVRVLRAYRLRLIHEVDMACMNSPAPLSLADAMKIVERHSSAMVDTLAALIVKDSLAANDPNVCGTARRLVSGSKP